MSRSRAPSEHSQWIKPEFAIPAHEIQQIRPLLRIPGNFRAFNADDLLLTQESLFIDQETPKTSVKALH